MLIEIQGKLGRNYDERLGMLEHIVKSAKDGKIGGVLVYNPVPQDKIAQYGLEMPMSCYRCCKPISDREIVIVEVHKSGHAVCFLHNYDCKPISQVH